MYVKVNEAFALRLKFGFTKWFSVSFVQEADCNKRELRGKCKSSAAKQDLYEP